MITIFRNLKSSCFAGYRIRDGYIKESSLNDGFLEVHLGPSLLCQRIETRGVTAQLRNSIENGCLESCFGLTGRGAID